MTSPWERMTAQEQDKLLEDLEVECDREDADWPTNNPDALSIKAAPYLWDPDIKRAKEKTSKGEKEPE